MAITVHPLADPDDYLDYVRDESTPFGSGRAAWGNGRLVVSGRSAAVLHGLPLRDVPLAPELTRLQRQRPGARGGRRVSAAVRHPDEVTVCRAGHLARADHRPTGDGAVSAVRPPGRDDHPPMTKRASALKSTGRRPILYVEHGATDGAPRRTKDGPHMLLLTRLSGPIFGLNPDLIERVEATPDTVVTLVNGSKYVVRESLDELVEMVRDYRAELVRASRPGTSPSSFATARRQGALQHPIEGDPAGATVLPLHTDRRPATDPIDTGEL